MSFRFKVCGITDQAGLEAAVAAGADAVGFNFHAESPRFVSPDTARGLVGRLPDHVVPVGVFVNRPLALVRDWMDRSRCAWAQFHGDEPPSDLEKFDRPWYPALRPSPEEPVDLDEWPTPFILVDARRSGAYGGTGQPADWDMAARLARRRPVILAGGLGPGNIEAALLAVRPAGVDVNSGVEESPGVKDADLLLAVGRRLAAWKERQGAPR